MEKVIHDILIKKSTMIQKNSQPISSCYKVDKKNVLGSGTYGVVHRVQHKTTKQIRACKTIPWKKIKNRQRFEDEVKILQTLDHPNVLKLYEYFEDSKNVYLITELCKGGELFDMIVQKEFFTEREACHIFKQIIQSINHCHKLGIVHRDLKPENFILVDNDIDNVQIKTIDFGLSKICHQLQHGKIERMHTKVGTPYYISPDVLSGSYDKACDLWSAGCILYIMLCGYPPFNGDDDQEIIKNVQNGKLIFDSDWANVSKEAIDLIKKLICKPERRLSAEEALEHKWFKRFQNINEQEMAVQNLKAFKRYMKTQKIQQAALTAIACQVSVDDIKELRELFQSLDKNGDGSISLEELKEGLGKRENGETLMQLLKAADTDQSGQIDYTEFIAATLDAQVFLRNDYLRTAFDMFDKDKSGKIDIGEICQMLGQEGMQDLQVTQDQLLKYIQEVDENGDGEIDFDEFCSMMNKCQSL